MKRSTARILTTHAGSLIRPIEIREVMGAIENGRDYDRAAFENMLKDEVAGVVRQQADTGIDIVDDGEFGKVGWFNYLEERLAGLEIRELRDDEHIPTIVDIAAEVKVFPEFYEAYFPLSQYDWLPPAESRSRIPIPLASGPKKSWDFSGPLSYTGQKVLQRDIDITFQKLQINTTL